MNISRPRSKQPIPPHATKVFDGHIFSVFQWKQEMYDGSHEVFEKIGRNDTVTVIPVTEDKKIIITIQEQPGIAEFIGLPGGIMDPGEEPLESAKRELLEETGDEAASYDLFYSTQMHTRIDWAMYSFIAKGCKKIKEPVLDKGEKIALKFVDFDEFIEMLLDERFRDTDLALRLLRMRHNKEQFEAFKTSLLS